MEKTLEIIQEEKNLVLIKNMKNLYSLWDQIGIKKQKQTSRCETAWDHILQLSEELYSEEYSTYNSLMQRIEVFSKEISELTKQLMVSWDGTIEGTLLEKEEMLRKKLSNLKQTKEVRMKKYHEFRNMELNYCKILNWSPMEISSKTGVPSENDICEIQQYISVLREERDKRLQKFVTAKKELSTILELTEIQPDTPFEKKLLSGNEESISLTDETLEILDQVVKKMKSRKEDLENEKKTLLEKLTNLWERLQISEDERNDFLSEHKDYKVSTLISIKDEIQKYEELKRQNLKKFISNLREELLSLWKDCFASDEEKKNFLFMSEEFNEELLQAHEIEVEKWRSFLTKIENIRKKIGKRNKLWDLLIEFENKASDPNRFKNRRGNLLKEEKERKKLGEDLPALENEIFLDIEKFEAENGTTFLYHGKDYREEVMKQWEERRIQKENEKIVRRQKHLLQVDNEAILGTPSVKRIRAAPRSAPSKLSKPSLGVAVYRTPAVGAFRNSPRTVGKKRILTKLSSVKGCLAYSAQKRIVLKETNENNVAESSPKDDLTYSAFSTSVNRSSKRLFRSSVLTSRKIVGTRISSSKKNKSRSVNKGSKKSTTNKDVAAKLTPDRGNLGLPVLI